MSRTHRFASSRETGRTYRAEEVASAAASRRRSPPLNRSPPYTPGPGELGSLVVLEDRDPRFAELPEDEKRFALVRVSSRDAEEGRDGVKRLRDEGVREDLASRSEERDSIDTRAELRRRVAEETVEEGCVVRRLDTLETRDEAREGVRDALEADARDGVTERAPPLDARDVAPAPEVRAVPVRWVETEPLLWGRSVEPVVRPEFPPEAEARAVSAKTKAEASSRTAHRVVGTLMASLLPLRASSRTSGRRMQEPFRSAVEPLDE